MMIHFETGGLLATICEGFLQWLKLFVHFLMSGQFVGVHESEGVKGSPFCLLWLFIMKLS